MSDGIIVEGRAYPVIHPVTKQPIRVRAWTDPPGEGPRVPEFRVGDGYNKKRAKWPVDLFVWHWTGGEAEPERVAETLRQRKFGVEFAIGRYGSIYQFCDPAYVDTADAGFANSRSVGCEVVNYGYRSWTYDPVRAIKLGPVIPKLGLDRPTYPASIHNRKLPPLARFYQEQIHSAVALAEAFSSAVPSVSRKVPVDVSGKLTTAVHDIAAWSGHLGHYHLTERKLDPGLDLLEALRQRFAAGGIS
jgi:hypothetical protein